MIISLVCLASHLQGQQAKIDSMLASLPSAASDSLAFDILQNVADEYSYFDAKKGIEYSNKALVLAEKMNKPEKKGIAYNLLGINYEGQSAYAKALDAYFESLKWNEAASNKKGEAASLSNIGNVFNAQGELGKALEYYQRALEINRELGNSTYMAVNLGNMGVVYFNQHKTEEALQAYSEALKLCRENHDPTNEVGNLINIAGIEAGRANYGKALDYFRQAEKIAADNHDRYLLASATVYIGDTYATFAKNYEAQSAGRLPLSKAAAIQKAIEMLKKGREQCREIGLLDPQMYAEKSLSEMHALAGNFRESLANYQSYTALKDSMFNSQNKVTIANLETKRELEIRDKQIEIDRLAVEKKRNERAYFIAGIFGLLLIIVGAVRSVILQKKGNRLLSIEKQRSDDLLLNILPGDTAEELKKNGSAQARRYESVSVLFTDFQNFTKFSESMSPEALVAEIDYCYRGFDQIVEQFGIEKIKTIGDAYMAAGGLPQINTSHAGDTVAAALAIRDFIAVYKAEWQAKGKPFLEIRIGVHTGPVVAGIVGSKKFAYDIWGDTVNIAARMESSGTAGKVNISQTTFLLVKDAFVCTHRGKIEAKNKGEIDMYFVEQPA